MAYHFEMKIEDKDHYMVPELAKIGGNVNRDSFTLGVMQLKYDTTTRTWFKDLSTVNLTKDELKQLVDYLTCGLEEMEKKGALDEF